MTPVVRSDASVYVCVCGFEQYGKVHSYLSTALSADYGYLFPTTTPSQNYEMKPGPSNNANMYEWPSAAVSYILYNKV